MANLLKIPLSLSKITKINTKKGRVRCESTAGVSYLAMSLERALYALAMVSMPLFMVMVRFPFSSLNCRSLPHAVALERMVEKIGLR